MLHDIRKTNTQKLAEAEIDGFRQALGPFVTAAEATRMPMMFVNAKSPLYPIIFVNQAFLYLTGYEEHEVMGQSFNDLMDQGADPEMLAELQTAFRGGRDLEPIVRYLRKDKSAIWVSLFIAPIRDADGNVIQYFASFVNVTTHRAETDLLRLAVKQLNEQISDLEQARAMR